MPRDLPEDLLAPLVTRICLWKSVKYVWKCVNVIIDFEYEPWIVNHLVKENPANGPWKINLALKSPWNTLELFSSKCVGTLQKDYDGWRVLQRDAQQVQDVRPGGQGAGGGGAAGAEPPVPLPQHRLPRRRRALQAQGP